MSERYTLGWRAPFSSRWTKSPSESLSSSLMFAWRKHHKGCSVDNITRGQRVIIDSEMMSQLLDEMDNIMSEHSKISLAEVAEQVIQGIEKAEANE